jgi:hypothetical protein
MAHTEQSLATYVGDMLALEEHIRVPLAAQCADRDFAGYPGARELAEETYDLCLRHIADLKSALSELEEDPAAGLKVTVTSIEGWFASAIDAVRKTKVAKALRDDYTALSLCTVGYSMLVTTAYAFENVEISTLAQRHLGDYAQAVMKISDAMPDVVLLDLQDAGLDAARVAAEESRAAIHAAWHSGGSPRTTTGTIESEAALNRSISSSTYPTI